MEVESGHYRLSHKLSLLAAKAFEAGFDGSGGPRRGRLSSILAAIAGRETTLSEVADDDDDETSDPLQTLAGNLAREALEKLQSLVHQSVAREFAARRDSLVAGAVRSLV